MSRMNSQMTRASLWQCRPGMWSESLQCSWVGSVFPRAAVLGGWISKEGLGPEGGAQGWMSAVNPEGGVPSIMEPCHTNVLAGVGSSDLDFSASRCEESRFHSFWITRSLVVCSVAQMAWEGLFPSRQPLGATALFSSSVVRLFGTHM